MKKNQPTEETTETPINPLTDYAYLRISVLAPHLGVSKNTIWRLVRDGKFPKPVKLSEKVTVFESKNVLAWLESKETK